jgi:Zn-dependent M28 family amino/carboxypeptidase
VIIAFWDAEEDGLLGSRAFVEAPVVPLDQIVTYVNFDMQGSRLLPSLADRTVAIGAETGGDELTNLVAEVTAASSLTYGMFSLIVGQGRSDHAPLADAGVPVVFFTDSTNGCYHSVDDELALVDVDKLAVQIDTVSALVRRLANDDVSIEFDPDAPTTSFHDAEQLQAFARAGEADLVAIDQETADAARGITETIDAVVTAGPDTYDGAAEGALLGAAAQLVEILTTLDCALAVPD